VKAFAAFVVAATIGLIAFLIIQFSSVSEDGIEVGSRRAEASCTEPSPDCIPKRTMVDLANIDWRPDQLAGKVVVINFWATWCKPCEREVPDLAATYRKYKDDGLVLLGLLRDRASEQVVDRFVQSHGLNYPVVRVDDDLFRAFGAPGTLPTTFIYDRSGHLLTVETGALTERRLDSLLAEPLAEK
jgi:thiol-disulfide isomerase/thioredoxin